MILDIYLPDKDGLEVITCLQKRAHPVKILAISGNAIDGFNTCETAKTLGADDAIAKPFSAEVLLQRVVTLLADS